MRIAIVGAHLTKRFAPFADKDWQIWSCSQRNADKMEIPRCDAWFEIHTNGSRKSANYPDYMEWLKGQPIVGRCYGDEEYRKWVKEQPIVYFQEHDPETPGSRIYPRAEMLAEFGPYFFTSSIAWMQALAITYQPEAIGLWGVEGNDGYGVQRSGILHFVQVARDRGIKVTAPEQCRLLDSPLCYGDTITAYG